jgi:aminoglycoside phosphotransferase (APT) family kinase protein
MDVSAQIEHALNGRVVSSKRLSGGASRTTSAIEFTGHDGQSSSLILQQVRSGSGDQLNRVAVEASLLELAMAQGVPVPRVLARGDASDISSAWLVVERLDGETIPRKILRDAEFATAREVLSAQCAGALAAIHRIEPSAVPHLPRKDPFHDLLAVLDALGEVRPALELAVRWLRTHPVDLGPSVVVHGDFRMGNLLVDHHGLRAVLDWELAHVGDAAEDIGWLCARAWRFGGPFEVGGVGRLDAFLAAYASAGGEIITPERVTWWEVYATVKWAIICALQATTHLSGQHRSVELAAIGRRVCENEWDALTRLGARPSEDSQLAMAEELPVTLFGRPTASELVEAVREYLDARVNDPDNSSGRFEARIARNALSIVERELAHGESMVAAHEARLAGLGFGDDASLASAIRSGSLDDRFDEVASALAASTRDALLVANPGYLD